MTVFSFCCWYYKGMCPISDGMLIGLELFLWNGVFTSGIICIVLVSGSIFRCIGKLSAADSESIARNGRNLHSFFTRIVRLLYQLLGFDRIFMLGKLYSQAIGSKIVHMLNNFGYFLSSHSIDNSYLLILKH